MPIERTPEAPKPEKKPRKPRKPRTVLLIRVDGEEQFVVNRAKTLRELRQYDANVPADATFIEAVQIGQPFKVGTITKTVREAVK